MGIGAGPTSIFRKDLFSSPVTMAASLFIKAMHPKAEIRPEAAAIEKMLKLGWVGQLKIHGHRAQIHVSHDDKIAPIVFNRQGKRHAVDLSPAMVKELRRLFRPEDGWNVVDAEWLKPEKKIFVFDFLKKEDKLLRAMTFPERWALLPKSFLSPHFKVLPLIKDLPSCVKALETEDDALEGLVFKSSSSTGFSDTSIVRCRKR